MTDERTQKLAERIAAVLTESERETRAELDFSVLQASLEKIFTRLDKIESQIAFQNSPPNPTYQLPNPKSVHPSQERHSVFEALPRETGESQTKEKACQFEPNGKPCDYCSMCSARGF